MFFNIRDKYSVLWRKLLSDRKVWQEVLPSISVKNCKTQTYLKISVKCICLIKPRWINPKRMED